MVMNGIYLSACGWEVTHGVAAGVMALLGALQPMFTALIVVLIQRDPVGRRTGLGLVIGFAGVALVLSPRLAGVSIEGLPPLPIALGLLSIIALTVGTMVQKLSLATADLRAAGAIQHLGAAIVAWTLAITTGIWQWDNAPTLWIALIWSAGARARRHGPVRLDGPTW